LGLTLLLLAVYGKALPALPISIFLGVTFYVMTRFSLQPWIQEIFIQECYV
jgi:presenilin 1